MTTHTPAQPLLTDKEIMDIMLYGQTDARLLENGRAIESALLSKLRAPVADELSKDERAAIEALIECASWAFHVADDGEDDGSGTVKVPLSTMKELDAALDKMELLPDDRPGYTMGPSSRAEWALRRFFGGTTIMGYEQQQSAALASAPVAGEAHEATKAAYERGRKKGNEEARSWTEDFAHENGNYMCKCHRCGQIFHGHKRRVTCKVCHTALASAPVAGEAQAEQFIQATIDQAPEPLRRLGEYLSRVLDEDQWTTAERMLLGACNAAPQASEAVRDEPECEPCNGMGIVDGMGDRCPSCNGSGALSAQPGAQEEQP